MPQLSTAYIHVQYNRFSFYVRPIKPVNKALFFKILGLQIFLQNIKVGGGKKIKIKITKNFFFI